ncbi:hypothetical protein ACHHYP_02682 [Achlya hypogyna]|uniref:Roadblock/LAMTOR2 domain-containing protein n=1 Tax=Achlya hypogyna TaxID=1202772 RepID=A0A1V9ZS19_ACHHY|nr:hypothetical protein ACHHYP_02682 [Achlya hypogyna]
MAAPTTAWSRFVDDLRVEGPHGPLFAGFLVYDAQGKVQLAEGWFTDANGAATKALFAAATDDTMSRHTVVLRSYAFQIIRNEYGNFAAVAHHRKLGLLTQRCGVAVVAAIVAWPYTVQTTFATMEAFGHRLRSA